MRDVVIIFNTGYFAKLDNHFSYIHIMCHMWRLYAVDITGTEFQTDMPIRTNLAGECENSSILSWQVRLSNLECVMGNNWSRINQELKV